MASLGIGMPIYNGENFAEDAIRSLLAQTRSEFDLVIADNASTDRTGEICRTYAEQDSRIRYFRHEVNRGAAYNFNFVFEKTDGDYFKWASHDDELAPAYLEQCSALLDGNPDVVLAQGGTEIIDDRGEFIEGYQCPMRLGSDLAHERFRDLTVIRHDCFLVFGVIRREALAATPRIGNYVGSDRVLLGELAIHGKFAETEALLFRRRRHDDCSVTLQEREERVAWFDPDKVGAITFPNWRILAECEAAISRAATGSTAARCRLHLPEQMWVRRSFLIDDLVEGSKLAMKKTRTGHRLFYFFKRLAGRGPAQ